MDHEPCKSRGDCYHARNGRIGGRIQGRKNVESGQLASIVVEGGYIQGRKNVESGHIVALGHIQGCKNVESGHIAALRRKNIESGHFISIGAKGGTKTAEILHQKPNIGEATIAALFMTFYPDVWADIIWQRRLPQNLRGVPDIRHPIKVVGEYDGGGHNAFVDRSENDTAKDTERRAAGFVVVRETNPYILVAKFAHAVHGRFTNVS